MSTEERDLRTAFADAADTFTADFEAGDYLGRLAGHCARPEAVDAAALLLADRERGLRTAVGSCERARRLGLAELSGAQGPCLDCCTAGRQVHVGDLAEAAGRWPVFAEALRAEGFQGVHALPVRLRDETLGAVGLFTAAPGPLDTGVVDRTGALAAVAAAGLVHRREALRRDEVIGQLQTALDSRVLIEQAKGVLAERLQVPVDRAFAMLRGHARRTNRKLAHTAREVVEGRLHITGQD